MQNSSLYSNIYAECVGYAFEQCFSSDIAIIREHEDCTDEEKLQELKALVDEYEMALELVDESKPLQWEISAVRRQLIHSAKTLQEACKQL